MSFSVYLLFPCKFADRRLVGENCPLVGLTAEGCSFLITLIALLGIKECRVE